MIAVIPRRSDATPSLCIENELQMTPAMLKLGTCRIEAMDDATFQRHRRLV